MKRTFVEFFLSLTIVFLAAETLRHIVYEPLENFILSQGVQQRALYGDIVLGKGTGLGSNNVPLPGSVGLFGILLSLMIVFFIWVYDLLALDDGGLKRVYIFIFVVNVLFWLYLFPEVIFEPVFGQINHTLVNLIKIPIF